MWLFASTYLSYKLLYSYIYVYKKYIIVMFYRALYIVFYFKITKATDISSSSVAEFYKSNFSFNKYDVEKNKIIKIIMLKIISSIFTLARP